MIHGEWSLHPLTINIIWGIFGRAETDLLTSVENTHCPLFYSLSALRVDALAHSWPEECKYASPLVKLLHHMLCKIREEREPVLHRNGPNSHGSQSWQRYSIGYPTEERPPLSSTGNDTVWHPNPELLNLHVWLLNEACQQRHKLSQLKYHHTGQGSFHTASLQYIHRWRVFTNWCRSRGEDPSYCPILIMVSFLQIFFYSGCTPSTLKVYGASITAFIVHMDNGPVGRNDLVVRFLKGARRLNPPRPCTLLVWDFPFMLDIRMGPSSCH